MSEGTLSVLCVDLTGGERLQERLAASEAKHAIGRCEKRISQTVEGFRGRLAKTSGSKVMAFFTDSEDALQSAVEMQRRISAFPPVSGVALGVRVGVCVGHASNEIRFFDNVPNNAAISLSDMAEPGQVLLGVPKRAKGFEWSDDLVARSLPGVTVACGKRNLGVYEIDWRKFAVGKIKTTPEKAGKADLELYLHFNGATVEVTRDRPLLSIGRLASCGMLLHSERCSRIHARIERRGDTFILVDQSTNGTFVTPEGGGEEGIHKRELLLSGRGKICFGESASVGNVEFASYAVGYQRET